MQYVNTSERAKNDLNRILRYLDGLKPSLADRFSDQLDRMLDLLARQPNLGKSRDDFQIGLRSVVIDRYVLFFRNEKDSIEVVRIIHGSRNIEMAFHETDDD